MGTDFRCATCVFFKLQFEDKSVAAWAHGHKIGLCRCKSPVADHEGMAVFPQIDGEDWCGEYQAKARA